MGSERVCDIFTWCLKISIYSSAGWFGDDLSYWNYVCWTWETLLYIVPLFEVRKWFFTDWCIYMLLFMYICLIISSKRFHASRNLMKNFIDSEVFYRYCLCVQGVKSHETSSSWFLKSYDTARYLDYRGWTNL